MAESAVSSAAAAGWSAIGPSQDGVATGTPAAASARGSAAAADTDRTITASCDQGTLSIRWARRRVSAISAACACSEPPPARRPSRRCRRARRGGATGGAGSRPAATPLIARPPRARTPVRAGQGDRRRVLGQQQRGVRAAESVDGLVRVTRQQREVGAGGQHPHQPGGLRIEVVRVVDQQQPDPGPLGGQQVGVRAERLERGADEFGGPSAGTVAWERRCRPPRATASPARTAGRSGPRQPIPGARTVGRCVAAAADPLPARRSGPAGPGVRWRTRRCSAPAQVRWPARGGLRAVGQVPGQQLPDDAVLLGAGHRRGGGSPARAAACRSTANA